MSQFASETFLEAVMLSLSNQLEQEKREFIEIYFKEIYISRMHALSFFEGMMYNVAIMFALGN